MVHASKYLALILRHRPESIGLTLDSGGWADVDELVARAQAQGVKLTRELVLEAVATNEKRRYALSEDGRRIRAVQGHSFPVDLGLEPRTPPDVLYHGTATRFLASIQSTGLEPRGRQHVHLSSELETARTVGARHGKLVVLTVDAAGLAGEGRCVSTCRRMGSG